MTPLQYARAHRADSVARLKSFLRIPSISTIPAHAGDVRIAADWVALRMRDCGLDDVTIYETGGHPVVYGRKLDSPGGPTVLIYGHYDVQPVDPVDLWESPPFEPTERDGKLRARGSADDKGQVLTHLEAIAAYMATWGFLPVNVIVLVEGEEEIGSEHLEAWMREHAEILQADVCVISDTHMISLDSPSMVYGLRGIVYAEIEVEGPQHDLHSGQYGGGVANPANALAYIISQLLDVQTGEILIPGFYDRVRPTDPSEQEEMARTPFDISSFTEATGAAGDWGEIDYSLVERLGARPTLDVNGLVSGWTGAGAKTVLPAKALAKISSRLVPDQDPDEVFAMLEAHVRAVAPEQVAVTLRNLHGARPSIVDRTTPAMQAAAKAYEIGFGKPPYFTREGGSIPVVALMADVLGIPTVLMGFGLPDDNLHAPNEGFSLDCFLGGILTSVAFMEEYARTRLT